MRGPAVHRCPHGAPGPRTVHFPPNATPSTHAPTHRARSTPAGSCTCTKYALDPPAASTNIPVDSALCAPSSSCQLLYFSNPRPPRCALSSPRHTSQQLTTASLASSSFTPLVRLVDLLLSTSSLRPLPPCFPRSPLSPLPCRLRNLNNINNDDDKQPTEARAPCAPDRDRRVARASPPVATRLRHPPFARHLVPLPPSKLAPCLPRRLRGAVGLLSVQFPPPSMSNVFHGLSGGWCGPSAGRQLPGPHLPCRPPDDAPRPRRSSPGRPLPLRA